MIDDYNDDPEEVERLASQLFRDNEYSVHTLSTIPTVIYSILNVIGCPKIQKIFSLDNL